MKIEETETSVRLIPENQWERDKLKKMREKGKIEKMEFQDDWNATGPLTLHYPQNPWGPQRFTT